MREATREPHTWIMSFLYIGTFGSFIGFGFAFGQVLQNQFTDSFATPLAAASLTLLGPLLGSLIRPIGGSLADRFGGARITFWNFVAMAVGAGVVLDGEPAGVAAAVRRRLRAAVRAQRHRQRLDLQDDPGDLPVPGAAAVAEGGDPAAADREALRMSGALIGIAGAVGAFGGVLVNLAFRQSFLTTGTGDAAYLVFIAFYVVCVVVTWVVYLRPQALHARLSVGSARCPVEPAKRPGGQICRWPLPRCRHGDRGAPGEQLRRRRDDGRPQAARRERLLVPELPDPVEGEPGAQRSRHAASGCGSWCREDPPPGVLAYDGDEVVGWAAVHPRADTSFARNRKIPHVDDLDVWSLWCIRVRPGHRGAGIAHHLSTAPWSSPAPTARRRSRATRSTTTARRSTSRWPTSARGSSSSGPASSRPPTPSR